MEPIFLSPVFQEKIWGGDTLKTHFHFDLPSHSIGEAWVISTHPHGESTVTSPSCYQGMRLNELYQQHRYLFGPNQPDTFPLLTKILDANKDLSVQVHPDDTYALEHEGELGKTECWYVIAAEPSAKIVYGHTAQTVDEFESLIYQHKWDTLLREIPVKAGDFFYVPHGTIHAIGGGITILETQQNSDTTYRVYDYDRTDDQGQTRELHINQSLQVTTIPHHDPHITPKEITENDNTITQYIQNDFFSVNKWSIRSTITLVLHGPYTLVTVINGEGTLNIDNKDYLIHQSQSFIIPHGIESITLHGTLDIISSTPTQ